MSWASSMAPETGNLRGLIERGLLRALPQE